MAQLSSFSAFAPTRRARRVLCAGLGLGAALLTLAGSRPQPGRPAPAASPPAAPLRVATYNLRYNTERDGPNAWPLRREHVRALVRYHRFDVFGTQEGLRDQLRDLAELPEYAFVGHGRDDGREAGEHSAIFYRRSRLRLLQTGDFWLSETPGQPGKGWDATCCNRICTWARFRDAAAGGREFYFFSVHFDHEGVVARRESGRLMVRQIREIAGQLPVVCAGDLNSTPDTEQVQTLAALLPDARPASTTPPYGPEGTFNGFEWAAPDDKRIDYLFVSPGSQVLTYATLTDSWHGRYPSDHFPVVADVLLP